MKVLLETCVWGGAMAPLTAAGPDLIWVGDWSSDPGDTEILALARQQMRVLVTLDKDFGKHAIVRRISHQSILRRVGLSAREQGPMKVRVLAGHGDELSRHRHGGKESRAYPAGSAPRNTHRRRGGGSRRRRSTTTLTRLRSSWSGRRNLWRRDRSWEALRSGPGRAEDSDGNGTWDLVQSRTDNKVNEITGISNSVGSAWVTPAYNRAGNMTTVPQPADPTKGYTGTYDAWNRLVKIVDVPTGQTVQENAFDGRTFRVVRKSYTAGVLSETRQLFFSTSWQVVEERVGAATAAERQFVWGLRYIDDLVVRDRDTTGGGTLNERLYALQDANWNVVAIASSAGAVQERYAYSAYGVAAVLTATFGARGSSSYTWDVLWTAYKYDIATRIFDVRYRNIDPILGVWITRDPFRRHSRVSLFEYDAPVNRVDPLGLESMIPYPRLPNGGFVNPITGKAYNPSWDEFVRSCARNCEVDKMTFTYDQMCLLVRRRLPDAPPTITEEIIPMGCIGITSALLGKKPFAVDFANCFTTLEAAIEERNKWRAEEKCCAAGKVGPSGKRATAQVFAFAWNRFDEDFDVDAASKRVKSRPRGRVNQDWGYFDDDLCRFWHANQGFITSPDTNKAKKQTEYYCSTPSAYARLQGESTIIYCVTCEGAGAPKDFVPPANIGGR